MMQTTLKTIYETGPQFYVNAFTGMYDDQPKSVFSLSATTLEAAIAEVSSRNWAGYTGISILHTRSQQGQGLAIRENGTVIL